VVVGEQVSLVRSDSRRWMRSTASSSGAIGFGEPRIVARALEDVADLVGPSRHGSEARRQSSSEAATARSGWLTRRGRRVRISGVEGAVQIAGQRGQRSIE